MEAIILAGGLGTRLRKAVPDVPKSMAQIKGRPFLEYLLDFWIGQGITRFILSVGYKADIIQQHFGDTYRKADIAYVVEQTPLGTGGGLLLAMSQFVTAEPVLVLNGDTFFEVDLVQMSRVHRDKEPAVTVALLQRLKNDRYQRVDLGPGGEIASFNARFGEGGSCLVNGGVYIMAPRAVADAAVGLGDTFSLENDLFPAMLKQGKRFRGYVSAGRFIDIGVPEDYFSVASAGLPVAKSAI
jgi:D-glycero-alpha-D-manno-heptose 1-phosphate guanylyltransferase